MQMFLQILGGLCLFTVVVAVGGWLFVRWKFRQLGKLAEQMGGSLVPPSGVSLDGVQEPDWIDSKWATKWIEEFRSAGFDEVGAFEITQLPDATIYGFCDPSRSIWGTVTEVGSIGRYAEIVAHYEDGRTFMATTQDPSMASNLPWTTAKYLPSARLEDLLNASDWDAPDGERKGVHPSVFVESYLAAYRRGMEYQFSQGQLKDAITPEIFALSAQSGAQYPDFGACRAALGVESAHDLIIMESDAAFEEDDRNLLNTMDGEGALIYVYASEPLKKVTDEFVSVAGGDVREHFELEKKFEGDAFDWIRHLAGQVAASGRFEKLADIVVMREPIEVWVFTDDGDD